MIYNIIKFTFGLFAVTYITFAGISFTFFPFFTMKLFNRLSDKLGTPFYGEEYHDKYMKEYQAMVENTDDSKKTHMMTLLLFRIMGVFWIFILYQILKTIL